jgi:hypothetical protein
MIKMNKLFFLLVLICHKHCAGQRIVKDGSHQRNENIADNCPGLPCNQVNTMFGYECTEAGYNYEEKCAAEAKAEAEAKAQADWAATYKNSCYDELGNQICP